jgi:multiple sugar transport system substrate-binding protein
MAMVSRRTILQAAALQAAMAGAVAVAGCAQQPANAATWSMWSSSAAEAKVWRDFSAYVQKILGLPSIPTLTPSTSYPTKLDLQLVSGTASMVTAVNGLLLPTYAARGALRPLDDLIKADPTVHLDDFYLGSQKLSSLAGNTYALGFDIAPTVLYYNKTMFIKRGIPLPSPTKPMTWAQFRELAIAFSEPADQYGFTCTPALDDMVSWIYCAGGDVMNADQSACILGTEKPMYALEFAVDLFIKDKVTPPISNLVTTDALANFMEGNVAFMQNGPWQVVNVRKADFEWDIVPFPAGPGGSQPRVSGSSFAIPAGTENVELAWKLLKTLTSTGALTIYAKAGRNNPARRTAGTAFRPPPANLSIVQRILAGEVAGGHPYEVTTNWNEVRQVCAQDLPRAFLGQAPIADVIAGLLPRLNNLMAQHQDNLRQTDAHAR